RRLRETGRGLASDGGARLPLLPAHVPAVEAVVRGDGLVAGVLDDDHVTDHRVVVEPGARGVRVVGALGVGQTHAAVAGVGAAEDGLGAPVVAVDEGAGGAQAHGVRHVLDVVLALAVVVGEADGRAVHPGLLELLGDHHLALVRLVLGRTGGDRDGPDGLAVPRDLHLLGLRVDVGDLVASDLEGDRLLLNAVDALGTLDAVELQLQGDRGAALPVVLGTAVHAVGVEPVTGDLLAAVGGDGDALLDIGLVGDRLVEVDGHRHADTHRGAVVRGEVADEAVGRRDGGERGVLVRRAALGVLGGRGQLVGGGPLQLAGGLPGLLVRGYLSLDGLAVGGRHLHLGERALGDGDGGGVVDGGVVGAVLGRDLDLGLGRLLGRRLVDLCLRGVVALVPVAVATAGTRREHHHSAEQSGRGHETLAPLTVRHHTLLHRRRFPKPRGAPGHGLEVPPTIPTLRPVVPVPSGPRMWDTPRPPLRAVRAPVGAWRETP